jgi:4-hydroxybenzoate polyprenyltransferase
MRISDLFRLCRIPNVFTAFANVVAGVVLARGGRFEGADALLVVASGALYCSGMVFNDLFDVGIDARERPERPLPSGAVSLAVAAVLAITLMSAGVTLAAFFSPRSAAVAALLAGAILLYDARLKKTWAGPLAMGLCRFLNVLLGLTAAPVSSAWYWAAPSAAGLYTAALTFVARDEVGGSSRRRGRVFVVFMALLSVLLLLVVLADPIAAGSAPTRALPFLLALLVGGAWLFGPLWRDVSGPVIGRAIGGGILLMPALDATLLAGFGHPPAAAVVLALAGPAYLLRRRYYLT